LIEWDKRKEKESEEALEDGVASNTRLLLDTMFFFDSGSVGEQTLISLGIMEVGFGIIAVRVFVLHLVLHTYSEGARFSLRFRRRRQGLMFLRWRI